MSKYAIGLDYGTLSVRALLVDIATGEEVARSVYEYPHACMEEKIPTRKCLPSGWSLQEPEDYVKGLVSTVNEIMATSQVLPKDVVGIGVDFTSSTVVSCKNDGTPMCSLPEFKDEPHAYVKLWKHHGAEAEAAYIDKIAKEREETWLPLYGGKVSSEWMLPKILETLNHAPELYAQTDRFMEALDWIIWQMTGVETRSACGAGYKMFYRHDLGYPSKEFFKALDPRLENLVEEKLNAPIKGIGETAGLLTDKMAATLGLMPGTPIGTGIVDAHASLPGCGIGEPGIMMVIVGTSSCHMMLSETEVGIEGVGGLVKDGIMPGYFGYEAGQCCVGDHFAWFTDNCVPESYHIEAREKGIDIHQLLEQKLGGYKAGQSGLIALDWWNGVRSPLMDFNLNGMMLGMNLLTKPEEMYLALIEATAYGTRNIIESFEKAGVYVESVVLSGGIPAKNKLLVQVYSDICKKDIKVSSSDQAGALGAVILGILAAGESVTGYKNANEIAKTIGSVNEKIYSPNRENTFIYDKLYAEYVTLLEYFGKGTNDVMKRLNAIRNKQNK